MIEQSDSIKNLDIPIVVDLDGTLLLTDTTLELCLQLIRKKIHLLPVLPFKLIQSRASFKAWISKKTLLQTDNLPWNNELIHYLKKEKEQGKTLIMATAAHNIIAAQMADFLGIFNDVIASSDTHNIKGPHKASILKKTFKEGYIYAGDSIIDIPVWKNAAGAIVVGNEQLVKETQVHCLIVHHFQPPANKGWRKWSLWIFQKLTQ